jgi:hypothetical protein
MCHKYTYAYTRALTHKHTHTHTHTHTHSYAPVQLEVDNSDDVVALMARGAGNRATSETKMNDRSSRRCAGTCAAATQSPNTGAPALRGAGSTQTDF